MGVEVMVGIGMGVLAAAQSFMGSESQRAQSEHAADVADANARAMRAQADLTRKEGEYAQREVDREREQLRREYEASAGSNRSLLAAGGVALDGGSPLDVLTGNATRFAADMGENRLRRATTGWSYNRKAQLADFQSEVYANEASWNRRTAGSLGSSLLTAGITGVMTGVGSYAWAGGTFGARPGGDGFAAGHVFDGNRTGGVGGGWNRVAMGTR